MNGLTMRPRKKSKDTLKQMKTGTQQPKVCGTQQKHPQERKFIASRAYLKKQKLQVNNLTLHLKKLEKVQKRKPKVSRRKGVIKIRVEIIDGLKNDTKDQ